MKPQASLTKLTHPKVAQEDAVSESADVARHVLAHTFLAWA